ncbi:MAG: type II toxin-antitoxin system VapC family toxin [Planctomycetes bacterium]|nr:type II toxin-antitoxin system VapC family toxin [Planctomycetota bacterium]
MSYWDTSTLGKLYLPETDSPGFVQKAANDPVIVISRLGLYEMRRVAFRKESEGLVRSGAADTILSQLDQDVAAGEIMILELDTRVEVSFNTIMATCYRRAPPISVRTFDAIHLATARVAGEAELVATDRRMREAAKLLGFSLFPA